MITKMGSALRFKKGNKKPTKGGEMNPNTKHGAEFVEIYRRAV